GRRRPVRPADLRLRGDRGTWHLRPADRLPAALHLIGANSASRTSPPMAQKAGTSVPESGTHAKVFPPLVPNTFAPQLMWLALTLGLLYLLLRRVVLPRVGEVIEERADRVKRDLEQAESLRTETQAALANYEQALGEARAKSNTLAKSMRDKL